MHAVPGVPGAGAIYLLKEQIMSERKVFSDSITPLPAQPGATPEGFMVSAMTPDRPDETLTVHFALSTAADVQKQLEATVASGKVATPQQLDKLYNASPADKDELVAWLKANGYEVT